MSIKMIVTDLDGTLFRSDKTISDYTKAVIARCQAKGIQFVAATARMKLLVDHFIPDIPLDGYICHNGAAVFFHGREIASCRISAAAVRQTLDNIRRVNPDAKLAVQANNTFYTNFDASLMTKASVMKQYNITELPNLDAEKINVLVSSPAEAAGYAPLLDDELYIVCSENTFGMIMRKDATKSNGIRAIAAAAGIPLSDIAAFGDDYNDIDMLTTCGYAIAVENAIAEVKAIAGDICEDNDHDGLAKWLEAHVIR
jgi:Cof subfamily protein (haloacid dehalogenase superfamily)